MSRTRKDLDGRYRKYPYVPSWFKRDRRRDTRRRVKQAVQKGREPERERRNDEWNYW